MNKTRERKRSEREVEGGGKYVALPLGWMPLKENDNEVQTQRSTLCCEERVFA